MSYPYVLASLLASVLLHVMAFVMMIGEKQPGNVLMCKIKTFLNISDFFLFYFIFYLFSLDVSPCHMSFSCLLPSLLRDTDVTLPLCFQVAELKAVGQQRP